MSGERTLFSGWLPNDVWVRRILVPVVVFMALVSDHGYLADFWHHLARGRAMVQEGGLVDRDIFTFTVSGQTFQDVNWLSQLLYYGFYQLGGLGLVQVVNALVLAGALAWLIEICRRQSGSLFWSSLVGAGVFLGLWHVLTVRPQTFSFLLFVVLLDILDRATSRPSLYFIPPLLLALWTNLHGAFPAGLILVGAFFLTAAWQSWRRGNLFSDPKPRRLGICLAACILATLINPYGWGIYLYVGQTSSRAALRGIDEWLPPSLDMLIGQAFVISLILFASLLLLGWRKGHRLQVRDWFLLALFLPLACTSARMVPWWLLVLAPLAGRLLAALWPQRATDLATAPTVGAGVTFALLLLAAFFSLPGLQEYNPLLTLRVKPRVEDDLETIHARLVEQLPSGRVFTRFEWGEYLSWSYISYSLEFQIFMDGRIEIYPDEVWNQYSVITRGQPGWQKILDEYRVDALLLDADYHTRTGLLPQVEQSSHWRKIGNVRGAILYLRN